MPIKFVLLSMMVLAISASQVIQCLAADMVDCVKQNYTLAIAHITYRFELADGSKDEVSGSGFVIKSDGHILTDAHVVRPPPVYTSAVVHDSVEVRLGSIYAPPIVGSVLARQNDLDIALIKIPVLEKPWPAVQLDVLGGSPNKSLLAFGFPGLSDLTWAGPGKITANNAVIDGQISDSWQVDIPLNQGMSGGPVFNEEGLVVGLAGALKTNTGGSISFVIPTRLSLALVPIVGIDSYAASPCAPSYDEFVKRFVRDGAIGTFRKDDMVDALYQTIMSQTGGTGQYKELKELGDVTDVKVLSKQEYPQGTTYSMKALHVSGASLWYVALNRVTHLIDLASMQPVTAAAQVACTPGVVTSFQLGNIATFDGNGSTVGTLQGVTASIIRECVNATDQRQRLHIDYGYYNGSGTWRGNQAMNLRLETSDGTGLQTFQTPLDRSRCIYGKAEMRGADFLLTGGIGNLVGKVEIDVERVSGPQTPC